MLVVTVMINSHVLRITIIPIFDGSHGVYSMKTHTNTVIILAIAAVLSMAAATTTTTLQNAFATTEV